MKTRLALARSILHDPELLLFDEPTSGLDPESSHAVLDLIREMTAEGRTVVMCTHLLSEAEGLADQVVVMEGGTDLIAGTPDELTRQFWPDPIVHLDAEDGRLLDRVAAWPGVVRLPTRPRLAHDSSSTTCRRVPDIVGGARRRRRPADPGRAARPDPRGPLLRGPPPGRRTTAGDGDGGRRRSSRSAPVGPRHRPHRRSGRRPEPARSRPGIRRGARATEEARR